MLLPWSTFKESIYVNSPCGCSLASLLPIQKSKMFIGFKNKNRQHVVENRNTGIRRLHPSLTICHFICHTCVVFELTYAQCADAVANSSPKWDHQVVPHTPLTSIDGLCSASLYLSKSNNLLPPCCQRIQVVVKKKLM